MKKRLCSVVLTAAMVIGLVSPAYGAALPETSVPETTQETVSSGDSAGADSGEALPEEAEEVTEAPAEDAGSSGGLRSCGDRRHRICHD